MFNNSLQAATCIVVAIGTVEFSHNEFTIGSRSDFVAYTLICHEIVQVGVRDCTIANTDDGPRIEVAHAVFLQSVVLGTVALGFRFGFLYGARPG